MEIVTQFCFQTAVVYTVKDQREVDQYHDRAVIIAEAIVGILHDFSKGSGRAVSFAVS